MNFCKEEGKENDFIIKAATGNIKRPTIIQHYPTLPEVRLNNQGAPLLGLAKSIYYQCKLYTLMTINFVLSLCRSITISIKLSFFIRTFFIRTLRLRLTKIIRTYNEHLYSG